MKKILFSLAILAAALTSSATAQTTNGKNEKTRIERNCEMPSSFVEGPLFTGITLTSEQKTKLEALCKSACENQSKEGKDKEGKGKNLKGKTDSKKLTAEQRKELKSKGAEARKEAKAKKIAARETMLKDIQKVLTPEQYVKFLENGFVYGNKPMDKRAKGFGKKKEAAAHGGPANNHHGNGRKDGKHKKSDRK